MKRKKKNTYIWVWLCEIWCSIVSEMGKNEKRNNWRLSVNWISEKIRDKLDFCLAFRYMVSRKFGTTSTLIRFEKTKIRKKKKKCELRSVGGFAQKWHGAVDIR